MTRRSYDQTFILSFLSLFHEEFRILFIVLRNLVAIDTRTISTMTVRHFLDTIQSIISLLGEPGIHQKSTGTYIPGEYCQ